MAATDANAWQPNWATHPGEHLAEYLDERALSQAEFARLAGMTPKLVSTIVAGTNPVTPETAVKLQRVLGLKADIWLSLQAAWDLHEVRRREGERAAHARDWLRRFPLAELRKLGRLPNTKDESALLGCVLDLLGIGTPDAYHARLSALAVHHRKGRRGGTSPEHELCWLMLGEERARGMNLPDYDEQRFLDACVEIRGLTVEDPAVFEPRMLDLCREAGVALVFQKPISKTCLFGSARWLNGGRPIIQMSLRMKSNDHFWWTFFHEAAHVVLHRGRNFADDQNGTDDGVETEADAWAERALVGDASLDAFAATCPRSKAEIGAFAHRVGIHPGIVVGMLQHRGVVPFSHMNDLKVRFEWADAVAV
ncbi:DNA-binding protein [Aureimonas sp. Leaf454]|uniref:HigA family addiction module antitoxin n=1 Tax=Aureimonas sp. Leaf454 TaxID=1736381 RepID=UPI0006FEDF2B|nr:HigA family addiction module antitoxin [Aureimonas sp. Leaf454]KQT51136.1 DNA-binding protein [Aureimonas sp. Leaf454]